jgi:hypothetical protein
LPKSKIRIPLYDDGSENNLSSDTNSSTSGDLEKNDGIFTRSILLSQKPGIQQLNLEILDASAFEVNNPKYDSVSKSFPFIIK